MAIIKKTARLLKDSMGDIKQPDRSKEAALLKPVEWPVTCTIDRGLEGAIACETKIGYVNGAEGRLVYRGYDVFDLAAYSTFEETAYLVIHGHLPNEQELAEFSKKLVAYRELPKTTRTISSLPLEQYTPMVALRMGLDAMRTIITKGAPPDRPPTPVDTDADTVAEISANGEQLEYKTRSNREDILNISYQIVAGLGTITAAIARIRQGRLPIEPDPDLGYAANFLYMTTGQRPSKQAERLMDISLILHMDHGMNASTFAAMLVASTQSDMFHCVGAGMGALSGPLHGGANEEVIYMLEEIGGPENVEEWFAKARAEKRKIMGFGHRVYKTYDPRARVLKPLAELVTKDNPDITVLYETALKLEETVVKELGNEKRIFPNVDFYSGLIYKGLGFDPAMFTPIFAVSRVVGWVARCLEYLENNRIFRPRAVYSGPIGNRYVNISERE
ncbi:MAG: citrate synthase/methylcitrate synthase [Limnochordia bacterium]|jgi:citrate synthase|nr:citrate synthase/methylcitrate synthase [Limnochordia bacterium]